ncbi:hypothetical protein EVAR_701_1 [Eumeta japonica]|uniref:Uncharacterized protein n=1 Tax=Eumeta variegata TaxID=151549 RepID=A0A4C1SDU9_EUMVA|nr:hypothetical protein EVAR_701_1 [Eumeta japonica]
MNALISGGSSFKISDNALTVEWNQSSGSLSRAARANEHADVVIASEHALAKSRLGVLWRACMQHARHKKYYLYSWVTFQIGMAPFISNKHLVHRDI